jgi:hypothetical protein
MLSRFSAFDKLNFWQSFGLLFTYVLIVDICLSLVAFEGVDFMNALVSMFYVQSQIFILLVLIMLFFGSLIMNEEVLKYILMLVILACVFFIIGLIMNKGFGIDASMSIGFYLDLTKPDVPEPE